MNAFAIRGAALGAFVNVFGVLPLLGQGSLTVLRWENIGPGGGGAYYEAAWHPTKPDVLLVGSDVGGLYKSTNNAASWRVSTKIDPSQTWREQASIYTVERLAYAPSSPDLVFAACWRGVFRSADGGETWKKLIDAPFPDFYGAVAVDPQDANIVMVASGGRYQYSPFASALGFATPYTAPAGYYWRSTDGGNTFVQAAGTGLPENFAATDLWIDPSSPPGNRLVILATFDGIFRSSDGGRTFVASSEGLTHPYVWDMDGGVHSDGRSVVYVTLQLSGRDPSVFDPGVFRSTDGGTTWKNVTGNIPTFDPDVNDGFWDWSVAVHPTNPDVAYVLNGNNDSIKSGVFKTINRGQSWTHVTADWTKPGFVAGYLSALTGQPGRSGNFLAISKADPSRLVFGNLFEIYHTSDGGATWQECYSGKVNADPADRRYASRGSEDTFVYDFAFDPADPSILWIGFEDVFMWETRDRGASMAHLQPEMAMLIRNRSADACWQLLPDPKRRGAYYAAMASPSSGVYLASGAVVYSTDGGKSWIDISGNLPLGRPELVLGPPPEGQTLPTIYAAVTGHGMFKTTDHGQTWSEMATGFQGGEKTNVYRLAIDAGNPSQLWVGLTTDLATVDTTGGLYRTRDGGDTWAKLAQFPAREVFALEYHQGKLYAGAATEVSDNAEGGIFVSSDDGDTWTRVMDQLFIRAITFDPNDANILYAAASMPPNLSQPPKLNPGIFRSADGGATWPQISQDLPHYALTSLAVDPLNSSHLYVGTLGLGALRAVLSSGGPPTYTLSGLADYDGSATGAIIISVYADATFTNKTGQVTLIAPGSYSISGLQAGSYFIRAFRDMNGNGMVDASEPLYRATASLSLPPDASEVNFSLQDPLPSDTEPPVITVDPAKISVALSGPEPNLLFGVRAQDNRDGDRTSQITAQGTVNVTVPGAYTVRYQVTDASGNAAAPATRVYHVRGKLTFVANFDSYAELSELSEKVPELAEPENRATVAEMFDRYVEEGYGAISFHPVTTVSGRVGFAPSPGVDLAAKGYRDGAPPPFADGTDRLRWAVEQAQRRGLTVFANIQAFSHVAKNTSHTVPGAQPLSDREIEAVVDLLVRPSRQGGYGFNGVTGELLPARWFPIVRRVTAAHGATHMHDTDRQEVVSDQELDYPPTLVWETLPDADILSLEEYGLRRIGPNTVMVGIARHLNRPLAIRSSTFGFTSPDDTGGFPGVYGPETVGNIFLFRRIQTGVETFIHFVTWADLPEEMATGLKNIPVSRFGDIQAFSTDQARQQIFNLVLHLGRGVTFGERYDSIGRYALGGLFEGATASGYKVVVSPVPVEAADAYLLLTTGQDDADGFFDLVPALEALFTTPKPVFLLTLKGLPNQGGWVRLREAFGLGQAGLSTFEDLAGTPQGRGPIPREVTWAGKTVRYLERDAIDRNAEVSAVELPADGSGMSAEILLPGAIGPVEGALVTRQGNKIFINGSRLDANVAFILSDLLNKPAKRLSPGDFWSTVGPNISGFIGYEEAETLRMQLPLKDQQPISIFRRDAKGQVGEKRDFYNAGLGFETFINKGEIVVVRTLEQLAYQIAGLANYSGSATGRITIAAYADANFTTKIAETAIAAPGAFTISGLPVGTYYLRAFRDTNGNGVRDADEPVSPATTAVDLIANVANMDLNLSDPAARLEIVSVRIVAQGLEITSTALTGRTYALEYKSDLSGPVWTRLKTQVAAGATVVFVDDTLGNAALRFYRVADLGTNGGGPTTQLDLGVTPSYEIAFNKDYDFARLAQDGIKRVSLYFTFKEFEIGFRDPAHPEGLDIASELDPVIQKLQSLGMRASLIIELTHTDCDESAPESCWLEYGIPPELLYDGSGNFMGFDNEALARRVETVVKDLARRYSPTVVTHLLVGNETDQYLRLHGHLADFKTLIQRVKTVLETVAPRPQIGTIFTFVPDADMTNYNDLARELAPGVDVMGFTLYPYLFPAVAGERITPTANWVTKWFNAANDIMGGKPFVITETAHPGAGDFGSEADQAAYARYVLDYLKGSMAPIQFVTWWCIEDSETHPFDGFRFTGLMTNDHAAKRPAYNLWAAGSQF